MRIGIFTDTYPPYVNGVSTSILMLKQGLEKKGHQVFVLTVNNEGFRYKEEENVLRTPGLPVGIYDYNITGIYPLGALTKVRKWNLDVIHSHTEFGAGTFARIFAKQFNIPLVHTYHTMYEDYVHYITKGHFMEIGKTIAKHLTLFYCDRTIDELIVPTKKAYELFKSKYVVKRDVHIIPTGIDIDRFYQTKSKVELEKLKLCLSLNKDDIIILFVGRLALEKNVEFLIKAFEKIKRTIRNSKLLIVGDGPDIDIYKKMASDLSLQKDIIFTGKVPWEEIPKYYQIASFFATASTSETQGLTVIEAMAAGVIPVCINDESFTNFIEDGKDGYIFENEQQYIEIIKKLSNDEKLLEKNKKLTRSKALLFSYENYATEAIKIYEKAINKKSNQKNIFNNIADMIKGNK